jgi:type III pantothenate kinase
MRAGIYYGTVGQVERILSGIEAELGVRPTVIATGGLADLWRQGIERIDRIDVHLTLSGLRLFWERCGG